MPRKKQRKKASPGGRRGAKVADDKKVVGDRAKRKDVCFVIMPFGGNFDRYYESIFRAAIEEAELEPHRADDLYRPSTIVSDIWTYTKDARLLLADLTGKNPNVFYELGLAHGIAKPAILVAESMDDIPFDLRALRIITYNKNDPEWGRILREAIVSAIGEVLKAPQEAVLPAFLNVQGAKSAAVTPREKGILEIKRDLDLLRAEVRSSPRREFGERGVDIGPERAESTIREMILAGIDERRIVELVTPLGPPEAWISRRYSKIKEGMASVLPQATGRGVAASTEPLPADEKKD